MSFYKNAHLKGAVLLRADMRGANLIRTDLRETNLMAADLRGITFDDMTIWSGAKYTKDTQWPTGFNPIIAGCVLVE